MPPSLYFLMGAILAPQTKEQTLALEESPSPGAKRLRKHTWGTSGGTMIWWNCCSTHGEREGKAAQGKVAEARGSGVCVCCVHVFGVSCVLLIVNYVRQRPPNYLPINIWQTMDPRGRLAQAKHCLAERMFHLCLDPRPG